MSRTSDTSLERCLEEYVASMEFQQRCFDNNLQKNLRANILEYGTGQILLIVALMNFKKYCIDLRRHIPAGPVRHVRWTFLREYLMSLN